MNRTEHAKSCEAAYGNAFAEVHDFLDQYSKAFPRQHRVLYHHRLGLALIAERFGSLAVQAGERHILEDEGVIPEDHTYYRNDNEALASLIQQAYGRSAAPDVDPEQQPRPAHAAGGAQREAVGDAALDARGRSLLQDAAYLDGIGPLLGLDLPRPAQ